MIVALAFVAVLMVNSVVLIGSLDASVDPNAARIGKNSISEKLFKF